MPTRYDRALAQLHRPGPAGQPPVPFRYCCTWVGVSLSVTRCSAICSESREGRIRELGVPHLDVSGVLSVDAGDDALAVRAEPVVGDVPLGRGDLQDGQRPAGVSPEHPHRAVTAPHGDLAASPG